MKIKKVRGGYVVTFSKRLFHEQVVNATVAVASCVIVFEAFWYGV